MVRIWMNHWFSTAYNIVNLIKQDDPEFFVIGSNENVSSPIRTVCDEWYHEPTLKDDTYVDYCVEFCREHYVDVFLPPKRYAGYQQTYSAFCLHWNKGYGR